MSNKALAPKTTHTTPVAQRSTSRPFFHQAQTDTASRAFFRLGAQTKLAMGSPGDKFEREADKVADTVTERGPPPRGAAPIAITRVAKGDLKRERAQSQVDEKDAPVQAQADDRQEPAVQAQSEEKQDDHAVQAQTATKGAVAQPTAEEKKDEPAVQAKTEEMEERSAVQTKADTTDEKKEERAVQKQAAGNKDERVVQSKSDEKEEPVQAQAIERDERNVQAKVDEKDVQAKEEEKDVQAKDEEKDIQAKEEEQDVQAKEEEQDVQAKVEERDIQAKDEERDEPVQARGRGDVPAPHGLADAEDRLHASRGNGQALPEQVRSRMESRMGADFSGVRIHTDAVAVQLSDLLKAQAFTLGRDIYFNADRFSPGTRAGEHLLAHELTHTVQQGAVKSKEIQLQAEPGTIQRLEDDASTIQIRPELLEAIKRARGEIGKVNAKKTDADGTRMGWERLYEYFYTAFGEKEVIHKDIIKYIIKVKGEGGKTSDPMPSWCGIMVWWSYKKAGIPIPDWKLGQGVLPVVRPRKPGELPRKGDIAYREKNQHFALVTGVEAPAERAGKTFKSIRVATLNGNTSGNDNLGGQIEEKWEPISRWEGFFDPVAKLDMPPVPLVETSVTPDQEKAAQAGVAAPELAAEPLPEKPLTDVAHLQENVASEPEVATAEDSAVALEMPPPLPAPADDAKAKLPARPPTPPVEKAAKVEVLPLEGPSDKAMVGFTTANPSQMAKTQPVLGGSLDGKLKGEQKSEVENAPVLVAKTNGKVEEGLTPPDQIPVPADAQIGDGVTGADPGALQATPHADRGPAPSNEANQKKVEEQEEDGFFGWLRDNFKSLLGGISTKDPGVNTSAGERPNVALEGEADPTRMANQRSDASTALRAERDTQTNALKNNPGQQNIQAKAINEEKTAAPTEETSVEIATAEDTGAAQYAEAPLSAEVRGKADELLKPDVDAHMAEATQQTEQAAGDRDTDKQSEITKAESDVAKANAQADKDQRDIVVKNRGDVAKQQKDGIEQAYDQVNAFNKEADTEHTEARKAVGDKVKDSEGKARTELDKGETDAQAEKAAGEKKAEDKKKELEDKEDDESWWDRAVSVVKKAVKAITSAIDAVFNAVRAAVKTIIEKAKNAAIGLINAARDWVVDKLNKFRDWAKGMVNTYLKDRFPGLAAKINGAIDTVVDGAIKGVNAVADAAVKAVEAVAGALAAALDKILQVFQVALKAAVAIAGAVITGDFAEALRIAIQAACEIAGVDPKPIFDFLDRAKSQIMSILKNPVPFFNNLMDAVAGGVDNFITNIKKHLINGLIGWLTGALADTPIKMPATLDGPGIFSMIMQILGLTYENIKAKLIKKFPPAAKIIAVIEKGVALITKLIREGPMALWEEAKAALSNLGEIVIGGIRSFVIDTVVKEAFTWLIGLLNPAGALVKVVKLLFDFVMFLIERFQQIKDFVMSVYEGIVAIASGNLEPAKKAVEDALARSLPVVISLLASLAGLGGIGKKVQEIIKKITKPIDKVVDKVLDYIIKFAKKIIAKLKAGAKKVKEKLLKWWKMKKGFTAADGSKHKLYFSGSEKSAKLMVASSNPSQVPPFLSAASKKIAKLKPAERGELETAHQTATTHNKNIEGLEKQLAQAKTPAQQQPLQDQINAEMESLVVALPKLFGIAGKPPPAVLPPMVMDVRAANFVAEYINQDVPDGTEASANPGGTLRGWGTLPPALKKPGQWVKMHMLPHRLGGDAADSNLVPASGPKTNVPFSHGIEKDAIKAKQAGTPVWYSMKVSFHGGALDGYPNSLAAKWGTYDESWKKKNDPGGDYSKSSIDPPQIRTVLDFTDPDIKAGDVGSFLGIPDASFPKIIIRVMPAGGYTGASDMLLRMLNQHQLNLKQGRQVTVGFDDKLADLKGKLAAKSASLVWKP
jgi:uncharacterized protein DUF4157